MIYDSDCISIHSFILSSAKHTLDGLPVSGRQPIPTTLSAVEYAKKRIFDIPSSLESSGTRSKRLGGPP